MRLDVAANIVTTASSVNNPLLLGEYRRTLDARYRLSIPPEWSAELSGRGGQCTLVKERAGALSLWTSPAWQQRLDQGTRLIRSKLEAGRFEGRLDDVQRLGRLLSTRHRAVQLAGRGRLVVPEEFREFLGVEPGAEVVVVGAALCVEIWRPTAWQRYLEETIPDFQRLLGDLTA